MSPNWLLNMASPLVGVPLYLFFISVLIGKGVWLVGMADGWGAHQGVISERSHQGVISEGSHLGGGVSPGGHQ